MNKKSRSARVGGDPRQIAARVARALGRRERRLARRASSRARRVEEDLGRVRVRINPRGRRDAEVRVRDVLGHDERSLREAFQRPVGLVREEQIWNLGEGLERRRRDVDGVDALAVQALRLWFVARVLEAVRALVPDRQNAGVRPERLDLRRRARGVEGFLVELHERLVDAPQEPRVGRLGAVEVRDGVAVRREVELLVLADGLDVAHVRGLDVAAALAVVAVAADVRVVVGPLDDEGQLPRREAVVGGHGVGVVVVPGVGIIKRTIRQRQRVAPPRVLVVDVELQ
mmetsp:Transcript_13638/g.40873  ORF Transcript_13638/g.40873 Transcript_13638/m.40873 type:complete len:286 (-) Transcript_13638:842-1699(-)